MRKINFDEMLRDMESFQQKMLVKMFEDFRELEKRIENGELQGKFEIKPFEGSGIKGFIGKGFFATPGIPDKPKDILPPLRPSPNEPRKPFYDINETTDNIQLYIELPGVEKEEIEIKTDPKNLGLRARNFHVDVDITKWLLDTDNIVTEYKNGILKVTISKIKVKEQLI